MSEDRRLIPPLEGVDIRRAYAYGGTRIEAAEIYGSLLTGANAALKDGSLTVFDAQNVPRIRIGKLSDGTYGIEVLNDTSETVSRIGQLADSDYGIEVVNDAGQAVKLSALAFGGVSHHIGSGVDATSTSYSSIPASPLSGTVIVGDTGVVDIGLNITFSSTVSGAGGWQQLWAVMSMTGANVMSASTWETTHGFLYFNNETDSDVPAAQAFGMGCSLHRTWRLTGLDPGSTTFTAQYKAPGEDVLLRARTLHVTPL